MSPPPSALPQPHPNRVRTSRVDAVHTPEVMKSFGDLGRAATANGALDKKTKELIALALSVAARCDPCIGFHMQSLITLGATRQEVDETIGVAVYMGGGPSLMYTAIAIAAFDEFSHENPGLAF